MYIQISWFHFWVHSSWSVPRTLSAAIPFLIFICLLVRTGRDSREYCQFVPLPPRSAACSRPVGCASHLVSALFRVRTAVPGGVFPGHPSLHHRRHGVMTLFFFNAIESVPFSRSVPSQWESAGHAPTLFAAVERIGPPAATPSAERTQPFGGGAEGDADNDHNGGGNSGRSECRAERTFSIRRNSLL